MNTKRRGKQGELSNFALHKKMIVGLNGTITEREGFVQMDTFFAEACSFGENGSSEAPQEICHSIRNFGPTYFLPNQASTIILRG